MSYSYRGERVGSIFVIRKISPFYYVNFVHGISRDV